MIIKSVVEKLAENLSDGYFAERPRGSQLGAVISSQSSIIPDKNYLENKLRGRLKRRMRGRKCRDRSIGEGILRDLMRLSSGKVGRTDYTTVFFIV